ncbi:MAG: hypothetical protein V4525_15965 [Pseudomonadota bacterium]
MLGAIICVFINRWFHISSSRPLAAVRFIEILEKAAKTTSNGIIQDIDIAEFKAHIWPWQACKINKLCKKYKAAKKRSDEWYTIIFNLHAYVSKYK